jgi:hypothetical protein
MSISEWLSAIYYAISIAAALGTLVITLSNNYQIRIVHKQTNSMKDELVKEVKKASFARGRLDAKRQTQEKVTNANRSSQRLTQAIV